MASVLAMPASRQPGFPAQEPGPAGDHEGHSQACQPWAGPEDEAQARAWETRPASRVPSWVVRPSGSCPGWEVGCTPLPSGPGGAEPSLGLSTTRQDVLLKWIKKLN